MGAPHAKYFWVVVRIQACYGGIGELTSKSLQGRHLAREFIFQGGVFADKHGIESRDDQRLANVGLRPVSPILIKVIEADVEPAMMM